MVLAHYSAFHDVLVNFRAALSSPDHADAGKVEGDGWLPIESAPHNEKVLLSWKDCLGEWTFEVFEASWGWRTDTVSNVSTHGKATHWRPLPSAPSEGAE
ncbi:DUF551 domain-containing protein [Brucella intermedia]|uniref:DUF551 domain-containing protein n=1 Tax=Brucella intermedia TaxID=94625 RepID=UPI00396AA4EE